MFTKKEESAVKLSQEELDEIASTIDYHEAAQVETMPADYVLIDAQLQMKSIVFGLKKVTPLLMLTTTRIAARLQLRGQGMLITSSIGAFSIMNMMLPGNVFPFLARTAKDEAEFLSLTVDVRPLDKSADTALELRQGPLEIVLPTIDAINQLADFFKPRETVDLSQAYAKASQNLAWIREATAVQLQEAVEKHKTLKLTLNMKAPVILLPQNPSKNNTDMLVLDLGHIQMLSDLSNESASQLNKDITSSALDRFYDRFTIRVDGVTMFLCDGGLKYYERQRFPLIEQFNLMLELHNSIVPNEPTVPKIKVYARLPGITFMFNEARYRRIMAIVDAVLAKPQLPQSHTKATV
jgi:vacuolar protein sorting-associated protein 13A/C